MSRYGDTPLGMVESGMEFVRICEKEKFYNIIISMKSSNPVVMVQANRLLAAKMIESGNVYPIHLGVTEAGEGEDGRIKSAIGIGTLLEDGIGDTIRVSLTEKPENEIPVAKTITLRYINKNINEIFKESFEYAINPFEFKRRTTNNIDNIGLANPPRIIVDLSRQGSFSFQDFTEIGYNFVEDKWNLSDQAADYIFIGSKSIDFEIPSGLSVIQNSDIWKNKKNCYPLFSVEEYLNTNVKKSDIINFIFIDSSDYSENTLAKINSDETSAIILDTANEYGMKEQRNFIFDLIKWEISTPVIIKRNYSKQDSKQFLIDSSIDTGALLIDGLIDGIWLESNQSPKIINQTSFGYFASNSLKNYQNRIYFMSFLWKNSV